MSCIYKPTTGPNDWKQFLAKPDLHWKTGYSAKSMAHSWEESDGIPSEVHDILLDQWGLVPEPLVVIPEYEVGLPGGNTNSQNDAFVLCKLGEKTAVIMVEGKVNEPFGPVIDDWFKEPTPGQTERLQYLCAKLGMAFPPYGALRYQLFHRTVSALIEAERFNADFAIMLVHSFSQEHVWFDDYVAFAAQLGAQATRGKLNQTTTTAGPPLFLGWVTGDREYLSR
jgi:hypothetical protein